MSLFAHAQGRILRHVIEFGHSTVLNSLCQIKYTCFHRSDQIRSLVLYQWSSDSLDKRELAGKLAKLNAIELAKFSRRVTGLPAHPFSLQAF
jgi:hypothetical protein